MTILIRKWQILKKRNLSYSFKICVATLILLLKKCQKRFPSDVRRPTKIGADHRLREVPKDDVRQQSAIIFRKMVF